MNFRRSLGITVFALVCGCVESDEDLDSTQAAMTARATAGSAGSGSSADPSCVDAHATATSGPNGTTCACPDGRTGGVDLICIESLVPSHRPGYTVVTPSDLPVPSVPEEDPELDPMLSRPNVPVTCVESGRVKLVGGMLAGCDANGDITCNAAASCFHHYSDPPKCFQAGCPGNDFLANVTSTNILINGATTGWPTWARVSACATLIATANIAVIAKCEWEYPLCSQSPWPAPTPGGVCKWAD